MVGHRSTLQSRVTVAVGYGGLPPCLDRFQAGRFGYKKKMILTGVNPALQTVSREMSRGDGEKEARINIYGIWSTDRSYVHTDSAPD